jgi:UDP-N-acetylmuramoylalanine--D-glutamate ligase
MGKSGRAALQFLLEKEPGREIWIYDDNNGYEPAGSVVGKPVRVLRAPDDFALLGQASEIVISPGVNGVEERFRPLREKSRIVSEIEFASRYYGGRVVAISGTNGKSTTTSLCHHLLKSSGRRCHIAGNIGNPWLQELLTGDGDEYAVLEISSFQLEEISSFRPRIALLTNLTPDHLDRYPSLQDYYAAKLRLFENQQGEDFKIINSGDAESMKLAAPCGKARNTFFSLADSNCGQSVFWSGKEIVFRREGSEKRVPVRHNPLKGLHNRENIAAAFAAATLCGLDTDSLAGFLETFRGLEHRMELAEKIGKVSFYNDSKATNVDAALKSVLGFEKNLVVILGGKHKGSSYLPLQEPLLKSARAVLLLGHAADAIFSELTALHDRMIRVRDLREAVRTGYRILASTGGDVLLAPACSSFDMFKNFEERGRVFCSEARELQKELRHG